MKNLKLFTIILLILTISLSLNGVHIKKNIAIDDDLPPYRSICSNNINV